MAKNIPAKAGSKYGDLYRRLIFLVLALVVYRIGTHIPVPGIDPDTLKELFNQQQGGILGLFNMFSGGALSRFSVFALGIMPYISASIIMQMLSYVLPSLESLRKEGESGRRKITQYTRYGTLLLGLFQALGIAVALETQPGLVIDPGFFFRSVCVISLVTGTMFLMWLGEQITERGIGNGISMLLFAGILARFPTMMGTLVELTKENPQRYFFESLAVLVIFIAMITFIVFMNNSERRIPIQYAKRVVGRKQYGGQSTHIPVKVCMSGVMPIIFAMSFMSLPSTIELFKPMYDDPVGGWQKFYNGFLTFFHTNSWGYAVIYFVLIIAFNYFYVSMQYNPIEIANNLRQSNGGIPGIRPGKPTSDYIQRVLSKITLVGAFFLGIIAIFPIAMNKADPNLSSLAMGGTTILIVVSVALETVRTLESEMMMRHHKGFLE